jgi:hypothetical protein
MKRLIAVLLALPGIAVAQPLLVPGRDVAVIYQVGGAAAQQIPGGAPDGVRMQWDATGQRLRAEPIGRPVYAITDLGRRVADIVFPEQTAFIEAPIRGGDPQSLLAGADVQFTRRGSAHVIGLECTEWAIHSRKIDGTGCVTPEGVVLRAEGIFDGRPGSMTAVSVVTGPQPASAFRTPEGFFKMALPGPKR